MTWSVVLFDLDHTLLDSDTSEQLAFAATLVSIGLDDPDPHFLTYDQINKGLWAAVERGELTPDVVKVRRWQLFLDAAEASADADPGVVAATYVTALSEHGDLFPGARRLLDAAKARSALGLVTNGLGSVQRRRVERLGLEPYFDVMSISAELGVAKPDPAIFELTMAELDVDADASVVMIGDSLTSDIAGGAAFGIDTIWFNPSGTERRRTTVEPTFEARSLDEITAIVAGDGSDR